MSGGGPRVRCRVARYAGDGRNTPGRHASTCLRCQADGAGLRRLRRALEALCDVTEPAPEGFAAAVELRIDRSARKTGPLQAAAVKLATAGAVAATATGAAVLVMWRRTHSAT